MSAAVVVKKAYKTYKSLTAPNWKRNFRLSSNLPSGAAGKSGLLDQLPVVVAVDRVSFSVEEGQIFGLVGPNGAGKTTLMRLLATMLTLDDGQIQIFGLDAVRQSQQIRQLINPMAGQASFFRKLSPLDNLLQDGRQYGIDEDATRHQVMDILAFLGMQERSILAPMEEIPACMQQMVSLARAILASPRLLLLDEPSTGLDRFTRQQLYALLGDLRQRMGTTIVLTSQSAEEAGMICDRYAILEHGQLMAIETPRALQDDLAFRLEEMLLDITCRQTYSLEAEIA